VSLDSLRARAARLDSLILTLPDDPFPADTAGAAPGGTPWAR